MGAHDTSTAPGLSLELGRRIAFRAAEDALSVKAHVQAIHASAPAHGGDTAVVLGVLRELLTDARISYGISDEALSHLAGQLLDPNFTGEVLVATGTPATVGKNASFTPAFDTVLAPGRVTSLEKANFFERGLLQKARKHDIIGRRSPPEPGAPGKNVYGVELPAIPGVDLEMSIGSGVRLIDGRDYIAQLDGAICWVQGRSLDVCDTIDHHGDVDLKSGNLDMEGTILVTGAVQPQLSVTASRDIMIGGNVESARILCGGNLTVLGSVFGGEGGAIISVEGDAAMRSAIRVRLSVKGRLTVDRELALCRVTAGELVLSGARGRIVGGSSRTRTLIDVHEVGSASGTPTELRLGWDAHGRAKLIRKLRALEFQSSQAGPRGRDQSRGKSRRNKEVSDRIANQERLRFQRAEEALLDEAKIIVRGTLFAGTTIIFGRRAILIEEDIHSSAVRYCRAAGTMIVERRST